MISLSLGWAIEGLLIALLFFAPWGFGGVEPVIELILDLGLTILLALWGLRMVVQGRITWQNCPVVLFLVCLFWFAVLQIAPLPSDVLTFLTPKASSLYQALLPPEQEKLPSTPYLPPTTGMTAGRSISLYPAQTRRESFRLLSLVLLFALIRNTNVSPQSLERLFIALTLNGVLLSCFAIIQYVSSPEGMVYWSIQSPGKVFGPFICRTHYAFYVNVCIGAALGLLICWRRRLLPESVSHSAVSDEPLSIRSLFDHPAHLGLILAIALMFASVVFSLSRGGCLTLLAAFGFLIVVYRPKRFHRTWIVPVIICVLVILGILGWLGLEEIDRRVTTMTTGEALQSRIPLWRDTCRIIPDFWLVGSGWGTFVFVEPLGRVESIHYLINEHAHNEFLEALVEGGVIRLFLTLLILVTIFYFGYSAYRRHVNRSLGGLILGALFGFLTLVVQSVGDFGIHLPAIALLATVISAFLVCLDQIPERSPHNGSEIPDGSFEIRLGGMAPILALVGLLFLGFLISFEGLRAYLSEDSRQFARKLKANPEAAEARVLVLNRGVRQSPDRVRLRMELGQAQLDAYDLEALKLNDTFAFQTVTEIALAPVLFPGTGLLSAIQVPLTIQVFRSINPADVFRQSLEQSTKEYLVPGMMNYVLARNICPLVAQTHLMIASKISLFEKANPRKEYLQRAKLLVTNDPRLYFLVGLEEFLDGLKEQACASWRKSLEISDGELQGILEISLKAPNPQDLLDSILPNDAETLLKAGLYIATVNKPPVEPRIYWEKAYNLARKRSPATARTQELTARILAALGRFDEAISFYREALLVHPKEIEWRFQLALLLVRMQKYEDARQELRITLGLKPDHLQARGLLDQLTIKRFKPKKR